MLLPNPILPTRVERDATWTCHCGSSVCAAAPEGRGCAAAVLVCVHRGLGGARSRGVGGLGGEGGLREADRPQREEMGRVETVLGEEGKGERGRPQRRARERRDHARVGESGESAGANGSVGGVEGRRGHREALRAVGGVESPTQSESLRRTIFSKTLSTIRRSSRRTQFILLRHGLKFGVDSC